MQTITDVSRLQKVVDKSSDIGTKSKLMVKRISKWVLNKLIYVIGCVVLSVMFFIIGFCFSKKERLNYE